MSVQETIAEEKIDYEKAFRQRKGIRVNFAA